MAGPIFVGHGRRGDRPGWADLRRRWEARRPPHGVRLFSSGARQDDRAWSSWGVGATAPWSGATWRLRRGAATAPWSAALRQPCGAGRPRMEFLGMGATAPRSGASWRLRRGAATASGVQLFGSRAGQEDRVWSSWGWERPPLGAAHLGGLEARRPPRGVRLSGSHARQDDRVWSSWGVGATA